MKIIFLDYDGVVNNLVFFDINGEPTFGYVGPDGEKSIDRQVNDFQAIAWLNKICREFECKLVITSTWRWRDDYQECLYRAGLNEKIEILGRTPKSNLGHQRGWEIQEWFFQNKDKYNIEDYIILDDDSDMLHFSSHLIKTDTYRGLGIYEYQEICKRWEKKNEQTNI